MTAAHRPARPAAPSAGTYPNPSLDVSGGPCRTGKRSPTSRRRPSSPARRASTATGAGTSRRARPRSRLLTSGFLNSAVGDGALGRLTPPGRAFNTAVGQVALSANTDGFSNSALGVGALDANTTASNNSALGANALGNNTTGSENTSGRDECPAPQHHRRRKYRRRGQCHVLRQQHRPEQLGARLLNALDSNTTSASNSAVSGGS